MRRKTIKRRAGQVAKSKKQGVISINRVPDRFNRSGGMPLYLVRIGKETEFFRGRNLEHVKQKVAAALKARIKKGSK